MLQVQVAYWANVENARHNKEQEKIGHANVELGYANLAEVQRHNVATEQETRRHDLAQESYWSNSLSETTRHDLSTEMLTDYSNVSGRISSLANQTNAQANQYNAQTNRFNAITGYSLGLDANRIAQENADSNKRNANSNFANAQTNRIQSELTREKNDQGWAALKLQESEVESENRRRTVQNFTDVYNSVTHGMMSGLDSVGRFYSNVLSHAH